MLAPLPLILSLAKNNMATHPPNSRGIAILYAVLLTSVILSIGLLLMDIVTKQIILASTGRNSQAAFYAANLGVECVKYWDNKEAFGFVEADLWSKENRLYDDPEDPLITCAGGEIPASWIEEVSDSQDQSFSTKFRIERPNACIKMSIKKDINFLNYQGESCSETDSCGDTLIMVSGYNTFCDDINDNPRTLERSIRILQ